MKMRIFAISIIVLLLCSYVLPGLLLRSGNFYNALLIGIFSLAFMFCVLTIGYLATEYIKRKKHRGIKSIRQYYLQRSTR